MTFALSSRSRMETGLRGRLQRLRFDLSARLRAMADSIESPASPALPFLLKDERRALDELNDISPVEGSRRGFEPATILIEGLTSQMVLDQDMFLRLRSKRVIDASGRVTALGRQTLELEELTDGGA